MQYSAGRRLGYWQLPENTISTPEKYSELNCRVIMYDMMCLAIQRDPAGLYDRIEKKPTTCSQTGMSFGALTEMLLPFMS